MGHHTGMVFLGHHMSTVTNNKNLTPNFIFVCVYYFRIGKGMSKEQHTDELSKIMVLTIVYINDCLSTVYGCEHNCKVF